MMPARSCASSVGGGGGGGRGLTFLYVTPASSCVSGPPEHKNITTPVVVVDED